MTESAGDPPAVLVGGSRLLVGIAGIGMILVAVAGLAFACFWALLAAAPVGSFLGPDTDGEQTIGVFMAIGGSLLAGSAFAAGLALVVRGAAQRWPSNKTLAVPPAAAFILVVAAALLGSSAS